MFVNTLQSRVPRTIINPMEPPYQSKQHPCAFVAPRTEHQNMKQIKLGAPKGALQGLGVYVLSDSERKLPHPRKYTQATVKQLQGTECVTGTFYYFTC